MRYQQAVIRICGLLFSLGSVSGSYAVEINPSNTGDILLTTGISRIYSGDFSGNGLSIQAGLFYSDRITIEAGYLTANGLQGGSIKNGLSGTLQNVVTTQVDKEANFSALRMSARYNVAYYPSSYHLFVKGGLAMWTLDRINSYRVANIKPDVVDNSPLALAQLQTTYPSASHSGTNIFVGMGVNYFITPAVALALEYNFHDTKPDRIKELGLSAAFLF